MAVRGTVNVNISGGPSSLVAIAASFTAEPILPSLQFMLKAAGLDLNIKFAPYDQVFQELLSPTSLLAQNVGGIDIVLVRVEDFARQAADTRDALAIFERTVPELCSALSQHANRVQVPTLLIVFPPSPACTEAKAKAVVAANATLVAHASSLPGFVLIRPTISIASLRRNVTTA